MADPKEKPKDEAPKPRPEEVRTKIEKFLAQAEALRRYGVRTTKVGSMLFVSLPYNH